MTVVTGTSTHVNADFTRCVVAQAEDAVWYPSPEPGVTRRLLDRVGGEVARATSVVRYAPGAHFPSHVHGGGEEILVLEGVFADESGRYPAGFYLRSPIGSRHAPFSAEGCTLFVKLRQFAADDLRTCRLDTRRGGWRDGDPAGVRVQMLHTHGREHVALERWTAGATCIRPVPAGGEEMYVLDGEIRVGTRVCAKDTWLRQPQGDVAAWQCVRECLMYRKTGHLPER